MIADPLAAGAAHRTYASSDYQAGTADWRSRELRRHNRKNYLLYFIAFVILQTAVTVVFSLTIIKVRTPRFRVRSATFDGFTVATQPNPSFDLDMTAQVGVQNANFGKYKYQSTTMTLFYRGSQVGKAVIRKSSVGWRSSKKFSVVVNLNSANLPSNSQLGADLSTGFLRLTSWAEMKGKVALMFVLSKKRNTEMKCSMDVVIATQQLANISCK